MKDSKIEWTDHTFNPWIGCTKVSPGCVNCYAENLMDKRYGKVKWGAGNPRQITSPTYWMQPHKWNNLSIYECPACGTNHTFDSRKMKDKWFDCGCTSTGTCCRERRQRVFCASLADVFDDEVPLMWLHDLLRLIDSTPNLDWLLLTKRPENILPRLKTIAATEKYYSVAQSWLDSNPIPRNIWLGTSVENQEQADKRIPILLQIPAKVRFLSMEPLLGHVEIFSKECGDLLYDSGDPYNPGSIDWIIVGGESGANARPMNPDWATSLRDQCLNAHDGVPFFFKQWDKKSGRLLEGREWNEFPKVHDPHGLEVSERIRKVRHQIKE